LGRKVSKVPNDCCNHDSNSGPLKQFVLNLSSITTRAKSLELPSIFMLNNTCIWNLRYIIQGFYIYRLLTGSILAHEMMHAWLRLKGTVIFPMIKSILKIYISVLSWTITSVYFRQAMAIWGLKLKKEYAKS